MHQFYEGCQLKYSFAGPFGDSYHPYVTPSTLAESGTAYW
jgi:hypothetical protein